MKHITPAAAIVLLLCGCNLFTIPREARINTHFATVLAEWRQANPEAKLTVEVETHLRALAEERAHGEATKEREALVKKATEVAGAAVSGNFYAAGVGGVGVLGLLYAGYKKRKAALAVPMVSKQIATERARESTTSVARATPDGGQADGGEPPA